MLSLSSFPSELPPHAVTISVIVIIAKSNRSIFIGIQVWLLLTNEDIDGTTAEIPTLADLVFKEALVGILDILGKIRIENESGDLGVTNL